MENNKAMKIAVFGLVGLVIGPTVVRTGCKLVGHAANKLLKNRNQESEHTDMEIIDAVAEETL